MRETLNHRNNKLKEDNILEFFLNAEENDERFNKNFNEKFNKKLFNVDNEALNHPVGLNINRLGGMALRAAVERGMPMAPLPYRFNGFAALDRPLDGSEISDLPGTTSYLTIVGAATHGAMDRLEAISTVVPQVIGKDKYLYLVTSGLSAQLVTGYQRPHKDVDLVLMDPEAIRYPEIFRTTDNVSPENFWAGMNLDPRFLAGTAYPALSPNGQVIYNADPGITLVQKTSDAWGREPREHDVLDATALGYWLVAQPEIKQKNHISTARRALGSMAYHQSAKTANRLNDLFQNYDELCARLEQQPSGNVLMSIIRNALGGKIEALPATN